jgi:hypothetical protein
MCIEAGFAIEAEIAGASQGRGGCAAWTMGCVPFRAILSWYPDVSLAKRSGVF